MPKIEYFHEQMIRYLKGLLSNRERHDLERKMMRDDFDEEAFDGLSQLSATELESDMAQLMHKLDERLHEGKKRNLGLFYRIAAAVTLLLGIGAVLYFVLQTPTPDLVTQEINPAKQVPPAEINTPAVPEPSVVAEEKDIDNAKPAPHRDEITITEDQLGEEAEISEPEQVSEALPAAEAAYEAVEPAQPRMVNQKAALTDPVKEKYEDSRSNYITGRVLGVDGQALPGVTIMEKGTSRGTITDVDGNFALQVEDSGSRLAISSIGYIPQELDTREVSRQGITLTEDIMALDEVVVIGYGERKKSDVTGAVSTLEAGDISGTGKPSSYTYSKPIPPGSSMKAFEKWVNNQVNQEQFRNFPGKHRIQVNMTIRIDGSIHDIRVKDMVPQPIAEEYKRIISLSPSWQPALKNKVPVEAAIMIRFVVEVE